MCRDLTFCRKTSVPKTSINITTTAATPTYRAPGSRTSEGENRVKGDGDRSPPMHAFIPGRRANDSMSSGAVDSSLFEHLWAFGRAKTAPVHRARGSNHVDIGNLVQRSEGRPQARSCQHP